MVIHNEIFDSYRLEQKSKKIKLSSQKEETIDDLMNNIITDVNELKKLLQDQKDWEQLFNKQKKLLQDQKDWEQFLINKKKKYEHSRLSISANTNARKSK